MACGYSRCVDDNPQWIEYGALCPYEHCIEIFPTHSQSKCALFGHLCPGGLKQIKSCEPEMENLRKQAVLREYAPEIKLLYLRHMKDFGNGIEPNDGSIGRFESYVQKCNEVIQTNPSKHGYHFCKGYALAILNGFSRSYSRVHYRNRFMSSGTRLSFLLRRCTKLHWAK